MLIIFSVWLGWFPIGLGVPAGMLVSDVTLGDRIYHLILPALTLSIIGVANVALHTRQKLLDVLNSDYVLFARAQGEEGRVLFWRHGLRNVALLITPQFPSLVSYLEVRYWLNRFFLPGLGQSTAGWFTW